MLWWLPVIHVASVQSPGRKETIAIFQIGLFAVAHALYKKPIQNENPKSEPQCSLFNVTYSSLDFSSVHN